MDIHVSGSRPTRARRRVFHRHGITDPIIQTEAPARLASTRVTFEPGARTAWHTHPLGQTLYVISGIGRVQAKGGPSRKSGREMWSGFRPVKNIGMALRRPTA